MGRTVVSPITIAHLLGTSVTSLYEGDTQHAFGHFRVKNLILTRQFRIKISMGNAHLSGQKLLATMWSET